jgi:hypothetical protein
MPPVWFASMVDSPPNKDRLPLVTPPRRREKMQLHLSIPRTGIGQDRHLPTAPIELLLSLGRLIDLAGWPRPKSLNRVVSYEPTKRLKIEHPIGESEDPINVVQAAQKRCLSRMP